jgi:hypothetical protein
MLYLMTEKIQNEDVYHPPMQPVAAPVHSAESAFYPYRSYQSKRYSPYGRY